LTARRRVLALGLPLGALALRRAGLEVVGAQVRRPAPGLRRLRRQLGADRVRVGPDVDPALLELAPDQIACFYWPRRLPERVLAAAPFAFNVHPSLLPRHRGPDPFFWSILEGDALVGATAHRLSPELDAGPILAQLAFPAPRDLDAGRLARWLDRPLLQLLVGVARARAEGTPLEARPQPLEAVSWAPFPTDEDCELRWSEPTARVLARIRAASPSPGAFTEVAGRSVTVLRARGAPPVPGLRVGEGVRTDEGFRVATADGSVVVTRWDGEVHLPRLPG
jgi:methionyl-tRNA formyltransferase